jgi:hypothetical protein
MCTIQVNNKDYRDYGFIKIETYPLRVCDRCDRELKLVKVQLVYCAGPTCLHSFRLSSMPVPASLPLHRKAETDTAYILLCSVPGVHPEGTALEAKRNSVLL